MADYIFEAQNPNGSDFDGGWHTIGVRAAVSEDATLIGGRAWYPNTDPANFVWIVYRESDEAVIASVDLDALFGAGAVNNDWNEFTSADFDTPGDVALDPAEKYYVAVATNGDYVFNNAASYPIGPGIITADRSQFFNGGAGPTFPDGGTNTSDWFFADALVEAAAAGVAVEGDAVGLAMVTAAAAKVANSASRAVAVAVAGSTVKKVTPAAGASAAVAAASATAAKRVAVTATCAAYASVTATTVKRSPSSSSTVAVAGVTSTAAKVAPVGGAAVGYPLVVIGSTARAVTGRCVGYAVIRHRPRVARPNTGTVTRPHTGTIVRPYTGVVPRP